jgi:hypothetical protein
MWKIFWSFSLKKERVTYIFRTLTEPSLSRNNPTQYSDILSASLRPKYQDFPHPLSYSWNNLNYSPLNHSAIHTNIPDYLKYLCNTRTKALQQLT